MKLTELSTKEVVATKYFKYTYMHDNASIKNITELILPGKFLHIAINYIYMQMEYKLQYSYMQIE